MTTPINPKATTIIPVTAPPRKATRSAGCSPPRAASAVRRLLRTEMFIPTYPAAALRAAPSRKRIAVCQPSAISRKTKITAPMAAMIEYWRLRYACAPSWMACAISRILALPSGCRSTQKIR